jgi:predicted nucleic-acid-binding Zn-ribbon protein
MWPWKKEGKTQSRKVGTYHCPKCNSTNIEQELALTGYIIIGRSLVYHCHDCDYKGMVVYNDFKGDLDEIEETKTDSGPAMEK